MNNKYKQYLDQLLIVLGQMNHYYCSNIIPDLNPNNNSKEKKCKFSAAGIMTMKVNERRNLIDDGHKLLEELKNKMP